MLATLMQDIRFGARMLKKAPGLTVIAVLTLALGIGANTAIFSVVNPVLLRPLPYPNSDQLVSLYETKRGQQNFSSPGNYVDWRDHNHSFQELIAWTTWFNTLAGTNEPEEVRIAKTTANFFPAFGVKPYLGRTYLSSEEQLGKNYVAVLSYDMWQRRFGGDTNVIGKAVILNDNSYEIIGVLPRDFHFVTPFASTDYQVWTPFAFTPEDLNRANRSMWVLGRLKPGVDIKQAQADLDTIAQQLAQQYGKTNSGWGVKVVSLQKDLSRFVRNGFSVLFAAVCAVLLIACGNVTNLLLARSMARQKEVAIRVALGASRMRVLRQLLTESVLLALLGGALGLGVAFVALRFLVSRLPAFPPIPYIERIGIDVPVLCFTLGISLVVGILFGLAPALRATKVNPNEGLESVRGASLGVRAGYLRNTLLVAEVALSLIMLVSADLLIEGFVRLLRVNPGFSYENVLTMRVTLPKSKYPGPPEISSFYQQALDHIKTLPQVQSVGAVNFLPLTFGVLTKFDIAGRPAALPGEEPRAQYEVVSPDYFRTLNISLLKGRYLADDDTEKTAGVVVVSESMARRFWPNEDPVGKSIKPLFPGSKNDWDPISRGDWLQVVGIVGDVRHASLASEPKPEMYLSFKQSPSPLMYLVVHTAYDPEAMVASVRDKVWEVDKTQPVAEIKSMQQLVSASLSQSRFDTFLLSMLAGLALVLASVGIYSVISYFVNERTREIGIHMALGAQQNQVMRMVLRQGMKLTILGLIIGVALSLVFSRILAGLLFGVKLAYPTPFIAVAALLLLIAVLASYIPAKRAMQVDPAIALRRE